jgi:murein DD-endopeptidase MepM/ murein hydrolase activator NlpD
MPSIHAGGLDDGHAAVIERPAATSGQTDGVPATADARGLADRDLEIPVQGVKRDQLVRSFHEERGSNREHEAIDILAPRNTPVVAVEDGRIAKLFLSKAGGNTIYQFDPAGEYCYYYAHLERYADGLREGDHVSRGDVIGYVGTSGNAPKDTPHLHFAVFRLTPEKHWWEGTPLDPYDILR